MEEERILVSFTDSVAIAYTLASVFHREGMGMKELRSHPKLECSTPTPLPKQNYENYDVVCALVLSLVATNPPELIERSHMTLIKVEHAQVLPTRTSSIRAAPISFLGPLPT